MIEHIEQIKKLECNQKLLSENSVDAIWTLDAETLKFEYMTESIKKISGYSADEYINRSASERLTPQSLKKITTILAEEMPRFEKGIKKIRAIEVQLIHKNEKKYWVIINAKFFKEPGGKLKIIGVTREISDIKRLQRQKDKLKKSLRKTTIEKEELLKEIKSIKELLPICSECNRIRDEHGDWWDFSVYKRYFKKKNRAKSNLVVCKDCEETFSPDKK